MPEPTPPAAAASEAQNTGYPVSGWVEAGLYVFAIAVLSLAYAVGNVHGAHPIAFILYAMLVSAVVLLAVNGPGPDALQIVLAWQSWLVGAGIILMEVFYYMVLQHVAPAYGSLQVRIAIPLSMLIGWLMFSRRPPRIAVIGALVIVAGIAPLFLLVEPAHRLPALVLSFSAGFAFNLRSFATEFHPWNRRAKTVRDKLRITGLVVLVTAGASLALTGLLTAAIAAGLLAPMSLVPTPAQMLHGPTIVLGLTVGGLLLTAMSYLSFSSVVKITTENFAATSAFTPLATLLAQIAGTAVGLIPAYTTTPGMIIAMAVVIGGVFLILSAVRRRR